MTPAISFLDLYLREVNTCPHKNLYMNVHRSIIHNSQKVETTPNAHQTDHYNRILSTNEKSEVPIHVTTWLNLENIIRSERSQSQSHILGDSIYIKYSDQTIPQKQKIDPASLGGWKVNSQGRQAFFLGAIKYSERDRGESRTNL